MKSSLKPSANGHRGLKPLEQERATVNDKNFIYPTNSFDSHSNLWYHFMNVGKQILYHSPNYQILASTDTLG